MTIESAASHCFPVFDETIYLLVINYQSVAMSLKCLVMAFFAILNVEALSALLYGVYKHSHDCDGPFDAVGGSQAYVLRRVRPRTTTTTTPPK